MARLSVSEKFEAFHGSFDAHNDTYTVSIRINGPVRDSFVAGMDSAALRENLSLTLRGLSATYLDDIVGRATNENIGLYLFHQLRKLPISAIRILGGGHEIEVYSADIDHSTYPARLLYERARSLLYRDRAVDAIGIVSKSIDLDNIFPPAFNLRGRCNRTMNRWDLALPDFEEAVRLNPEFGEAYRNIGNALYYLGRIGETAAAFNRAIDLMPTSALAINNRGFAYQKLGEWELALTDHKCAIDLDPNYAEAHKDKAVALIALGRTAEACEEEKTAKELKLTGKDTYAKKIFY